MMYALLHGTVSLKKMNEVCLEDVATGTRLKMLQLDSRLDSIRVAYVELEFDFIYQIRCSVEELDKPIYWLEKLDRAHGQAT